MGGDHRKGFGGSGAWRSACCKQRAARQRARVRAGRGVLAPTSMRRASWWLGSSPWARLDSMAGGSRVWGGGLLLK